MADVPVQAVEGKPYQIDFPLASLAPGEYLIQLDAKTGSGTAQQTSRSKSAPERYTSSTAHHKVHEDSKAQR